jgi:type VI secretion system protein ImpL
MKRIFRLIFNRFVISVLGIILLALLIWFIGPLIAVAGFEPLAEPTVRMIVILVVFLIWGIRNLWVALRAKKTNTQVIEELGQAPAAAEAEAADSVASREEVALLRDRFQEALATLKSAKLGGRRGRRQLYQLPWYLMIGPPGAGKTTALKNSGLRFPLEEKFGSAAIKGVGGTRNCDWWFTEEAVLLDTAGRYTTQDSDAAADRAAWTGFLDLLKRHRRRRPIDGVLIAFSVTDIAQSDSTEREMHAHAVRQRLQELHETLKIQVPIYVIFTKCDLVAGFVEYFDDLGRDERGQVWGATFPLATSRQPATLPDAFAAEFDLMMERLDSRMFTRFDGERDPVRRGAIQGFVHQVNLLREPLQAFLREIFQPSRFESQSLLRGVYFSSGTQEGTPIDRVISAIAGTYGLDRQALPAFSGPGKSFFLTRLLGDVVFQEAGLVTGTGLFDRFRGAIQWGSYVAGAAALGLLALAWMTSYTRNQVFVGDVETQLAAYEDFAAKVPANAGVADILPQLETLRTLPSGYEDREASVPLTMGFGLYQGDKLGEAARAAYRRSLNTLLLPRLLSRLEGQIQENVLNPELLYEALKVYLMLGNPRFMDEDLVQAWIGLDFETRLPGPSNDQRRSALNAHVATLLREEFRPLPLDAGIVSQARAVLLRQPLSLRVYGQIKQAAQNSGNSPWRLTDKIGGNAAQFFTRGSASLSDAIPYLFTVDGFREHYLARGQILVREAASETWVLGPEYESGMSEAQIATLTKEVTELYLAEYVQTWDSFIASLDIVAFRDFSHAVGIVNGLSAVDSPLKTLLVAISEETQLTKTPSLPGGLAENAGRLQDVKDRLARLLQLAPDVQASTTAANPFTAVDRHFEKLHALVGGPNQGAAPIDQVITMLKDLYLHLATISSAGSQGEAARAAVSGGSGIVQQVRFEADRLPAPVNRWLRSLSQASARITNTAVQARLGTVWSSEIGAYCSRALAGRYPLSKSSPQDANLSDFAQYFAPQGLVDQFFNKYLTSLVDTSVRPWRRLGGQTSVSDSALAHMEAASRVRESFFAGGSGSPLVNFEIRPVKLDKSASQVIFELGGQKLTYRHGPTRSASMQWPAPDGSNRARLAFTAISAGRTVNLSAEGPWALFRLLDQGSVSQDSAADRFRVIFDVQGMSAEFELRASSVANPFQSSAIERFSCLNTF